MAIYYLGVDDVEGINHKLVSKSEASYNYKGGIEFILSNMKSLYEELPEREAVIAKTAYLWHSIASNQYFSNGNKRTGYVAADVFLQINNMRLNAIEDEKFFVSYAIANKIYEIDHVRYWIAKSLK